MFFGQNDLSRKSLVTARTKYYRNLALKKGENDVPVSKKYNKYRADILKTFCVYFY
jgi:hypothetical protein